MSSTSDGSSVSGGEERLIDNRQSENGDEGKLMIQLKMN